MLSSPPRRCSLNNIAKQISRVANNIPRSTTADSSLSPDGSYGNGYSYTIVGAGIVGSALASRLAQRYTHNPNLLVEARKSSYKDNPLVPQTLVAPLLHGNELDWNYETIPQEHLGGHKIYEAAGEALGGVSVTHDGIVTFRCESVEWPS